MVVFSCSSGLSAHTFCERVVKMGNGQVQKHDNKSEKREDGTIEKLPEGAEVVDAKSLKEKEKSRVESNESPSS